jgi:hypothetical protein
MFGNVNSCAFWLEHRSDLDVVRYWPDAIDNRWERTVAPHQFVMP